MTDIYKEILLNRIYRDMKQVLTNTYYTSLLIDRQIYRSKIFNCVISICSVGGAALSLVNAYIPMATGILVGLSTMVKQFFPIFFMEPGEITKLNGLSAEYSIYFQRLQNVFGKLFAGKINVDEASHEYDILVSEYSEKQILMSKLFGSINKKLNALAAKKSDNYLNDIYNGN
nr:MAG TPA: SMODS and SLOG-associating 2TM effector domain family 4 [Caudoviricetes sp.]